MISGYHLRLLPFLKLLYESVLIQSLSLTSILCEYEGYIIMILALCRAIPVPVNKCPVEIKLPDSIYTCATFKEKPFEYVAMISGDLLWLLPFLSCSVS